MARDCAAASRESVIRAGTRMGRRRGARAPTRSWVEYGGPGHEQLDWVPIKWMLTQSSQSPMLVDPIVRAGGLVLMHGPPRGQDAT